MHYGKGQHTGSRRLTLNRPALCAARLLALAAILAALTFFFDGRIYATTVAPTLTATAQGPDSVAISWTGAPGAERYELWRWHNGAWTQLDNPATPSDRSYIDTNVVAGQSYWYIVVGVIAGRKGDWSNQVLVTLPPAALTLTATLDSPTSSIVTWNAVAGADSYELYRWRDGGAWIQVGRRADHNHL